jgi:HAD superfamily hydrolase (TIGR01509 family)
MTNPSDLTALVRGTRLLCLDAGNTIIFLDHPRLARWVNDRGSSVTAEALLRTEGETKLLQEQGGMFDAAWRGRELPGAHGWGKTVGTILYRAGVPADTVAAWLPDLWDDHMRFNYWSLVPDGLARALEQVRGRGIKVAVVSNSEGRLDELFVELGVRAQIDLLLDSGKVGIEKPDPRIFRMALDAFGVTGAAALHLGDSIATDVIGARAAGIRVALIDPHGQSAGRALDVPRVSSVAEVADAMGLSSAK